MRFGYRDYDPGVGRFTAPDPARDRRGDGDLYDYCVDDPVSCVDPAGLKEEAAATGAKWWWNIFPLFAPPDSPQYRYAEGSLKNSLMPFGRGMAGIDGPPIDPVIFGLGRMVPDFEERYDEAMERARKRKYQK